MKFKVFVLAASSVMAIASASASAKPVYGAWGVEAKDMDRTVKPGDSFFQYVEGHWLKTAQIASDKARAGYNYDLPDATEIEVRQLVEAAGAAPANLEMQQVSNFYVAYMDQAAIEARGVAPLQPYLNRIAGISDKHQLVTLMSEPAYSGPIDIGIAADAKDPTRYTVVSGQARLGLPTRDYYLLKGAKYDSIRKAYRDYIAQTFKLAGITRGEAKADAILSLETRLSKDQWTPERRRDPQATYNPMNRAQLARLAPQFDWTATLKHIGRGCSPDDLERLDGLPVYQRPFAIPAQGVRRRELWLLRQDAPGRAVAGRAMEARRSPARRLARRICRPALCRAALDSADGAASQRTRWRFARGLWRPHQPRELDG